MRRRVSDRARVRDRTLRVSGSHLVVLLAGLVGTGLTLTALHRAEHNVAVVAVTHAVSEGTTLRSSDLTTVMLHADGGVLASFVLGDALPSVVGKVATTNIASGAVVRASELRSVAAYEGTRSMSIAVDASDAVDGTLQAGDRVDVAGVARDGGDAGFIATNVRVISATSPRSIGPLKQTASRITLTLAVDGTQALALVQAQANGHIVFVNATGAITSIVPMSSTANATAATPTTATAGRHG